MALHISGLDDLGCFSARGNKGSLLLWVFRNHGVECKICVLFRLEEYGESYLLQQRQQVTIRSKYYLYS